MEQNGFLFSALTLETSPLFQWWDSLQSQVRTQFPTLKAKSAADLHITLVYVGRWSAADLPIFRSASLVSPQEDQKLVGHLHYFGVGNRVLGLDLRGFSEQWARAVIAAREDLERAGLRGWAHHDAVFRPHVSFVECAEKRPTPEALAELARCRKWLETKMPVDGLPIHIAAGTTAQLLLAGANGGAEGRAYRPVEEATAPS